MNLTMALSCSRLSLFLQGVQRGGNNGYLLPGAAAAAAAASGSNRNIYTVNFTRKKVVGKLVTNGHGHDQEASTAQRGGIGITEFFQGKSIFITGATGLVGSAIIEKLLRATDVTKIYVLVRAQDCEDALDRLEKEIVSKELFKLLQEKHGKNYKAFIKEKIIPVVGDICNDQNLGMLSDSADALIKNVNVIIHSAAGTTLNDRYDVLLDLNTRSVERVMNFAKQCQNLEMFVQISTTYVNGKREGVILETPLLNIGSTGSDQRLDHKVPSSSTLLHIADELNLIRKSATASNNYDMTKNMKRIGMDRANLYGWYCTYHLTKAMAEMVVNEMRGDMPVLILRPSAIESCFKEPSPGWIQGNRVFDPFVISYGKGQLPAFLGDPDAPMDIVPLDLVANTTIAAIAKHGFTPNSGLNVYQMASSSANPLTYSDFFEILYEYFSSDPLIESKSLTRVNYNDIVAKIKYFDNFSDFSKYTRDEITRRGRVGGEMSEKRSRARIAYAESLCKSYEFLGFFKARFHNGNTQKLFCEMSKEERIEFGNDVTNIDWRKYFHEVHIPGVRRHVLKEDLVLV